MLTFPCSFMPLQHCYVLDAGGAGIFVWTGKNAAYEFKKKVWEGVNVSITDFRPHNYVKIHQPLAHNGIFRI